MKNKKLLYGGLLLLGVVGLYMWNKKSTSVSDTYTESELNDKINKFAKEEYAKIKNNPAGVKSETQIIDGLKTLIERVKKNGFTSKKDIDTLFLLIPKMNDNTLTIEERLKLDKFLEVKKPKTYSKECMDSLNRRLMQEDVKKPNFENDFLENCAKNEKK
jgi:hypothetical protein